MDQSKILSSGNGLTTELKRILSTLYIFDIVSLFAAELEEPNIGMWSKGLRGSTHITEKILLTKSFLPFQLSHLYQKSLFQGL